MGNFIHEMMRAFFRRTIHRDSDGDSESREGDFLENFFGLRIRNSRPITRRDPGPDGVLSTSDDGDIFTIYDYDAAFRGSNFVGNQEVNRPDGRNDYYNSYEASITRRMTGSWSLLAAYTGTKYHRYLVGIMTDPSNG